MFSLKHIAISIFILVINNLASFGQTASLSATVTATDAKCNGSTNGSATITVNGGTSPYSYTWMPLGGNTSIANELTAGIYSITVVDAKGLTIHDTITINQPPALTVSIDSIIVQPCFLVSTGGGACGCGNTLWAIVNGGTAPYKYAWTPYGETTDSIFHVCYVLFTVTVTDTNNCTAGNSLNVVLPPPPNSTSGIAGNNDISDIKLYPVPAGNQLNISLNKAALASQIEIYDMLGKQVMAQKVNDGAIIVTLDISILLEGNYLFRITGTDGQKTIRFSKSSN